jgi:hypothetical protein
MLEARSPTPFAVGEISHPVREYSREKMPIALGQLCEPRTIGARGGDSDLAGFSREPRCARGCAGGILEGVSDGLSSFAKLAGGFVADHAPWRKPTAIVGYGATAVTTFGYAFA